MLQFDKMKIVTRKEYCTNIDEDAFHKDSNSKGVWYYKYQQVSPFSLLIMVDLTHEELVIEFTGKILGDRYPELITKDNVLDCLTRVNDMNICSLDVDAILNNSEVVKCDVTKDVEYPSINDMRQCIKQQIANFDKWNLKKYLNGFAINNTVSTDRHKKRLVVYDKYKEFMMDVNREFRKSLSNSSIVAEYFKGKVRFESNLNSKYQVKKQLGITDNRLFSVLNSEENPLLVFIKQILVNTTISKEDGDLSLKDYERKLLLENCNYDLARVEATVRKYTPKNRVIKRVMQPYRDLFSRLQHTNETVVDFAMLLM